MFLTAVILFAALGLMLSVSQGGDGLPPAPSTGGGGLSTLDAPPSADSGQDDLDYEPDTPATDGIHAGKPPKDDEDDDEEDEDDDDSAIAENDDDEEEDDDDDEISDRLLNRVEALTGLSRKEAMKFKSKAALESYLALAEKAVGRGNATPQPPAPKPDAAPPAKPAADAKPDKMPPASAADDIFKDFEVTLNPDEYDPQHIETLKGIAAHYGKQTKAIMGILNNAVAGYNAMAQQQMISAFDTIVVQMGDDYKDLLGEGDTEDLSPKSKEFKARFSILKEVDELKGLYAARGERSPSFKALVKKAAASIYHDHIRKQERTKISKQLRNREGRFTARPTHRTELPQSGEAKAIKNAAAFMKERGMIAEPSDLESSLL